MDSAFAKFSPLQPAIFAAVAGTTAYATAAIAAAPSNLLSMLLSFFCFHSSSVIAGCCENDCSPIDGKLQNEIRAIEM